MKATLRDADHLFQQSSSNQYLYRKIKFICVLVFPLLHQVVAYENQLHILQQFCNVLRSTEDIYP